MQNPKSNPDGTKSGDEFTASNWDRRKLAPETINWQRIVQASTISERFSSGLDHYNDHGSHLLGERSEVVKRLSKRRDLDRERADFVIEHAAYIGLIDLLCDGKLVHAGSNQGGDQ